MTAKCETVGAVHRTAQAIETRSAAALTRCLPHSFTFYLPDPSARLSQSPLPLLIIDSHLRRWPVQFHLVTYFLDERFLLFQFRFEGVNFILLLLDRAMLL